MSPVRSRQARRELQNLQKRCEHKYDRKACKLIREFEKEKRAHPSLPAHIVLKIAKDHMRY